jgi:hypothetical protein
MKADNNMPATVTKRVNPVRPAKVLDQQRVYGKWGCEHTWTNVPLGLKTGYTSKTSHGEKVEEDLGGMADHSWLGYNHLDRKDVSRREIDSESGSIAAPISRP